MCRTGANESLIYRQNTIALDYKWFTPIKQMKAFKIRTKFVVRIKFEDGNDLNKWKENSNNFCPNF